MQVYWPVEHLLPFHRQIPWGRNVMQMHWFREGDLNGKFINFLTILGFDLIPLMKVLKRREPREESEERCC